MNEVCVREYDFEATGECIGELGGVHDECLENSNGEVLEIETILTCYCELRVKQLRKGETIT